MFPKVQRAYTVLSDPQKRAIYDLYGEEGVEAGHELAPYYNSVAEVRGERV
jgi:DnaJ family protein C protein 11